MRLMYDSTAVDDIPPSAPMVAGYANGTYTNYAAMKARFGHGPVLGISVRPRHDELAHVLDIETGDAQPADFQPWARAMANAGVHRPTAYVSRYLVKAVLAHRPVGAVVDLWIADWTGVPHRLYYPGANVVAVQYAAPGAGANGHYDVSAVWDDTWHPS